MRYPIYILLMLASGGLLAAPPDAENVTVLGQNVYLSDGARALQLKDFDEGIRLTLMGLRHEPSRRDRALALSNLCAGYVGIKQYGLALESCNAALDIRPRLWRAYNNRALAYLGQNRLAAARQDVEQGLSINPTSRTLIESRNLVDDRFERATMVAVVSPQDD
jgi:tetratricopeptide (TPR) repeat protein